MRQAQRPSRLDAVLGPAWPLLIVLVGFPGLLALLFAAATRNDQPLMTGFTRALGLGAALLAVAVAGWAVQRQARVQHVWALRLAPRAAGQRVAGAVAWGLRLVWLVVMAPQALLLLSQQGGREAAGFASLLALLMLSVAAWACAWQGRLGLWGLLPVALAVAAGAGLGTQALWLHWLHTGLLVQALVLTGCAAALPRLLAAQGGRHTGPSVVWRAMWQRLGERWRQHYRLVRERGEAPYTWPVLFLPVVNIFISGPNTRYLFFDNPLDPSTAATSGIFIGVMAVAAYGMVCSGDLHWRRRLARGAHLRQRLGWRVLGHTLQAHAWVAGVLLLIFLAATAGLSEGGLLHNMALTAKVAGVVALHWLLAVLAAVWLRGLMLSGGRLIALGAGLCAAWSAAGAALVLAGLSARGEVLLVLLAGSAALLLPAIRSAWQRRDLASLMQGPEKTERGTA